jgi:Xaa-Pro aminopeptidase
MTPAVARARGRSSTSKPPKTSPTSASASSAFESRLARLRERIERAGAGALLVTNPKDVGYLTGFLNGDSYLLVPGPGRTRPTMISDFRFEEELEPVKTLANVVIRTGPILDAVARVVRESGLRGDSVGVQNEHLTIALRNALVEKLGWTVMETTGLVSGLRVIKDDVEIELITKAVRIQEKALEDVLDGLKAGMTELEVAGNLEAAMKTRGSSEPGFQSIVAAGAHGSLPHYRPGPTKLASNKPVLIDWGAVFKGYHSDMTRVLSLGKWQPKIREIYEIVLEAQEAAASALAPGKLTSDIDAIARGIIERAGYGLQFGHGLGHGLGLDGHEEPRLTHMLAPSTLAPGMVVTVEPGIYLPGVGGVRIEDDYVVTQTGAKRLNTLPKSLEWASR